MKYKQFFNETLKHLFYIPNLTFLRLSFILSFACLYSPPINYHPLHTVDDQLSGAVYGV